MRVVLVLVAASVMGCSFIGASVPDRPPAPEHCPNGVMIADGVGTVLFLLPPTIGLADCLTGGCKNDPGWLPLFIFGLPSAIIGTIYLGSTIYGVHEGRKCERLKQAELEEVTNTRPASAAPPPRAPVVGDTPMYCAITEPDVGACFADEAACAQEAARGGACEPRQTTWCFDVTSIVGGKYETTCAASQIDCDARRIIHTRDASLNVTTCGTYQVRGNSVK